MFLIKWTQEDKKLDIYENRERHYPKTDAVDVIVVLMIHVSHIPVSLSAVPGDERGESWGRGGRRKWLSGNVRHPERRAAHGLCHHACADHLLWTDTARIAEDLNTRTISAPGLNPETHFSTSQLCWLLLNHLPSWTRSCNVWAPSKPWTVKTRWTWL